MGRLFGTAGIRGRYLEKVHPELAYRLGLAVAFYIGGIGTATVGHDVRTTSPLLSQLAAAGLMAGGVDAIYLEMVPTPVLAYSVPHTNSKSGIMVTASHNPPPDNGLKVFDEKGMEYTENMERDLEALIGVPESLRLHASWDRVGRLVLGTEIQSRYMRDIVERLETSEIKRKPKIAIDCANGAASNVTPKILRDLNADVISINCHPDGTFPGRTPEPRDDVLKPYSDSVKNLNVEALLAHDGDADRLAVVIPSYGFVKQDLLIALFAKEKLKDRNGTLVVSVDVGMEVEEIAEKMGGRIVRAKLGKVHEKLRDIPGALLGAEPWKLIDPEWGLWVDGIYEAALIARILSTTDKSLKDLFEELPFYPSIRVSYTVSSDDEKERLYAVLREKVIDLMGKGNVSISELDGVRLRWDNEKWILLRKSGTESKIRLYMQAKRREDLLELFKTSKNLVVTTARELSIPITGLQEHFSLERI
jgi:phosphoglucosamine mutase